jgi:hypothetical protein
LVCVAPQGRSDDCDRFLSLGPSIRALSVARDAGLSAALAAGIAAARGDVLIAVEASRQYLPEQIEWLLKRLVRADLIIGRRTRGPLAKLALGVMQLPRRVLLGLEVRDPDCLFWAARREAVADLPLAAGMHRFLGSLVATRGYRVTEIYIDHTPREQMPHGRDGRASLRNLLSVWRERRKEEAARRNQAAVLTPAPKLGPAATREAAPADLTSRSAA